jgi:lysylphosphatidylglycerol synthetase-like protein (DUF2156 family)
MKKIIKRIGLSLSAVLVLSFAALNVLSAPSASAAAADPKNAVCNGVNDSIVGGCSGNANIDSIWVWVGSIVGWLLTAVGVICVIFIIIGGIRYATSGGDTEKVKKAKDTLLYALIGLAICILANVIVSLITNTLPSLVNTTT